MCTVCEKQKQKNMKMAAGSDSSFAADFLPSAWTTERLKNTEYALQPAWNNTIYRAEVLAKLLNSLRLAEGSPHSAALHSAESLLGNSEKNVSNL